MKNKIEVLFVGAELAPLVKAGGLGDVMGSLPKALSKLGVNVKIIIPFYGSINKRKYKIKLVKKGLTVEIEDRKNRFDLYQGNLPGSKVQVFLVKHPLFDYKDIYLGKRRSIKNNVYSREVSDIERFVFFSKSIVSVIKTMQWNLDVVHCHDWHTALVPTFIDEEYLGDSHFDNIKSLFTIHNLANQGIAKLDIVDYANLHEKMTPALMEDYYDRDGRIIDLMKIGILSADYINTVSPNYAKEILGRQYGEGLEKYLQRRKKHLAGIVNGLDLNFFDPAKDKFIKKKYSIKNFALGKKKNKEYLQEISKLPLALDIPLFGLVTRLVRQKGLDILLPALDRILAKFDVQVVVLGTGRDEYEQSFKDLAKKYPKKLKANITFSAALAQKIYAGSDFFLMPSKFEPCGLGQMISMRYGSIPLVRQTGGLKDTVENNVDGLSFKDYKSSEMFKILQKAVKLYKNKFKMRQMISQGMRKDFSWDSSAKKYLQLYKKLK